MSKVKYYYDSETLSYRKIEHKKGRKTGLFILSFMGVLLSGFLLMLLFLNLPNFETPKEKELNRELTNLEFQVKLLNKKMNQAETVLTEIAERDNNLYRIYFEANPIPQEQRKAGFGGINRYKDLEGFDNSKLIISSNKRIDILTKQIVVQSKSLDEIIKVNYIDLNNSSKPLHIQHIHLRNNQLNFIIFFTKKWHSTSVEGFFIYNISF